MHLSLEIAASAAGMIVKMGMFRLKGKKSRGGLRPLPHHESSGQFGLAGNDVGLGVPVAGTGL